jgi:Mg/Co/Ni transporter MgtE
LLLRIHEMSAAEIMTEIDRLPETEREKVLRFAECRAQGRLTTEELMELSKKMVETADETEAEALKEEIVRGFYGNLTPLPNEGVVIPTW